MKPNDAPVVGLIGGVGSGKSALAEWLAGRLRVRVIAGDAAGHRALERDDVREQIRRRFGGEVFETNGAVRRDRLAEQVFGSAPEQQAARRDLETIVHPAIAADLRRQLDAAKRSADIDVILLDAAVLVEAGWHRMCDAVVFVDAPEPQRLARVAASRGWSAADLHRREASQLPLAEKQRAADFLVDNSGSLDDAGRGLLASIRQLGRSLRSCDERHRSPSGS